jgi:hypothetical protein
MGSYFQMSDAFVPPRPRRPMNDLGRLPPTAEVCFQAGRGREAGTKREDVHARAMPVRKACAPAKVRGAVSSFVKQQRNSSGCPTL